jgi:hypothetical protein
MIYIQPQQTTIGSTHYLSLTFSLAVFNPTGGAPM